MSQVYKLVKRAAKPGDKTSGTKYYAVTKNNGFTDMETLCSHITERSTVSSADVKAVLDNLNYILDVELRAGRIVQLGEFGNFRISVGSEGSDEAKAFSTSMLRRPKIVFTPGAALRGTKNNITFQRANSDRQKENGGENTGDGNEQDGII